MAVYHSFSTLLDILKFHVHVVTLGNKKWIHNEAPLNHMGIWYIVSLKLFIWNYCYVIVQQDINGALLLLSLVILLFMFSL